MDLLQDASTILLFEEGRQESRRGTATVEWLR
jgi:hypothetical protein